MEARGSKLNVIASFGFRLRQHCEFLTLYSLFKTIFEKKLIKAKEIAINAKS
jgi:hypothetical protein